MVKITKTEIDRYRANTFRTLPSLRIMSKEEAVAYANERGFIFFWPIKGILLPSLWVSVAGDRPVSDAHDDPGHVTWGWKDSLLGGKEWYYGKILRKKATMISHEIAPYFYALTENYGSPEEDYLTQYEQGKMTLEAKLVYEALLDNGPQDTIALRKSAHLTSHDSDARFNRALVDLQVDFKILPIGTAEAGAWNYAFIYEIVARHYPELPERARYLQDVSSRATLCDHYLRSVGAAQMSDIEKLFQWGKIETQRAVEWLTKHEVIRTNCEVEDSPGNWIVHSTLFSEK